MATLSWQIDSAVSEETGVWALQALHEDSRFVWMTDHEVPLTWTFDSRHNKFILGGDEGHGLTMHRFDDDAKDYSVAKGMTGDAYFDAAHVKGWTMPRGLIKLWKEGVAEITFYEPDYLVGFSGAPEDLGDERFYNIVAHNLSSILEEAGFIVDVRAWEYDKDLYSHDMEGWAQGHPPIQKAPEPGGRFRFDEQNYGDYPEIPRTAAIPSLESWLDKEEIGVGRMSLGQIEGFLGAHYNIVKFLQRGKFDGLSAFVDRIVTNITRTQHWIAGTSLIKEQLEEAKMFMESGWGNAEKNAIGSLTTAWEDLQAIIEREILPAFKPQKVDRQPKMGEYISVNGGLVVGKVDKDKVLYFDEDADGNAQPYHLYGVRPYKYVNKVWEKTEQPLYWFVPADVTGVNLTDYDAAQREQRTKKLIDEAPRDKDKKLIWESKIAATDKQKEKATQAMENFSLGIKELNSANYALAGPGDHGWEKLKRAKAYLVMAQSAFNQNGRSAKLIKGIYDRVDRYVNTKGGNNFYYDEDTGEDEWQDFVSLDDIIEDATEVWEMVQDHLDKNVFYDEVIQQQRSKGIHNQWGVDTRPPEERGRLNWSKVAGSLNKANEELDSAYTIFYDAAMNDDRMLGLQYMSEYLKKAEAYLTQAGMKGLVEQSQSIRKRIEGVSKFAPEGLSPEHTKLVIDNLIGNVLEDFNRLENAVRLEVGEIGQYEEPVDDHEYYAQQAYEEEIEQARPDLKRKWQVDQRPPEARGRLKWSSKYIDYVELMSQLTQQYHAGELEEDEYYRLHNQVREMALEDSDDPDFHENKGYKRSNWNKFRVARTFKTSSILTDVQQVAQEFVEEYRASGMEIDSKFIEHIAYEIYACSVQNKIAPLLYGGGTEMARAFFKVYLRNPNLSVNQMFAAMMQAYNGEFSIDDIEDQKHEDWQIDYDALLECIEDVKELVNTNGEEVGNWDPYIGDLEEIETVWKDVNPDLSTKMWEAFQNDNFPEVLRILNETKIMADYGPYEYDHDTKDRVIKQVQRNQEMRDPNTNRLKWSTEQPTIDGEELIDNLEFIRDNITDYNLVIPLIKHIQEQARLMRPYTIQHVADYEFIYRLMDIALEELRKDNPGRARNALTRAIADTKFMVRRKDDPLPTVDEIDRVKRHQDTLNNWQVESAEHIPSNRYGGGEAILDDGTKFIFEVEEIAQDNYGMSARIYDVNTSTQYELLTDGNIYPVGPFEEPIDEFTPIGHSDYWEEREIDNPYDDEGSYNAQKEDERRRRHVELMDKWKTSMAFDDPLTPMYWEELTPRVQKVVADNAQRIHDELAKTTYGPLDATTDCGLACDLWEKAFHQAGIDDVEVIDGNYHHEEGPYPMSTDHVWLVVDGKIFDPTAIQFGSSIDQEHYRTSMAERTGEPELDALIEQFITQDESEVELNDYEYKSLDSMRDPSNSSGMCHSLAGQFERFMRDNGIEAWSSEGGEWSSGSVLIEELTAPEDFGYYDRKIPGANNHCVTQIEFNGKQYMVDWSASQYGYSEFPMVQRRPATHDKWQRKWSMATRTGDPLIDQAIESFLAENPEIDSYCGMWSWQDLKMPTPTLDKMNHPGYASGNCGEVSRMFEEWCDQHNVEAYSYQNSYKNNHPFRTPEEAGGFSPEFWGYQDRGFQGYPGHDSTVVQGSDGMWYMVDFTAAQYGYKEFPMVQRIPDAEGLKPEDRPKWEREWTSATKESYGLPGYVAAIYLPEKELFVAADNERASHLTLLGAYYKSEGWTGKQPAKAHHLAYNPKTATLVSFSKGGPDPNAVIAARKAGYPVTQTGYIGISANSDGFADKMLLDIQKVGSQVVHQFPDNWTIHKLDNEAERQAEGQYLNHQWSEATSADQPTYLEHSLRNPQGQPEASFFELSDMTMDDHPIITEVLGPNGQQPAKEHMDRLKSWGEVGYPVDRWRSVDKPYSYYSKTSMPYWHVSPVNKREKIEQKGLRAPNDGRPRLHKPEDSYWLHLWDNMENVDAFRQFLEEDEGMATDVWEVAPDATYPTYDETTDTWLHPGADFDMVEDPYFEHTIDPEYWDDERGTHGAWRTKRRFKPDEVRRLSG